MEVTQMNLWVDVINVCLPCRCSPAQRSTIRPTNRTTVKQKMEPGIKEVTVQTAKTPKNKTRFY